MAENTLDFGDNLTILRYNIRAETVNLVYIGRTSYRMFSRANPDRVRRIARATLATLLLAALLASVAPLDTFATGPMCTLDCCAGRAPHAAGSCMDGTCHAALRKRANHSHPSQTGIGERLCSSSLHMLRRLPLGSTNKTPPRPTNTERKKAPQLSSNTVSKPCLPDCGGIGSSFAAADYRNHAAVGRGQQLRPNTGTDAANGYLALLVTPTALLRQHAPRAPPISFF